MKVSHCFRVPSDSKKLSINRFTIYMNKKYNALIIAITIHLAKQLFFLNEIKTMEISVSELSED